MESRVEIPWEKPKRIVIFIVVYNAQISLVSVYVQEKNPKPYL